MENCGSAVIGVISFLRGQLINHGTRPTTPTIQSKPIAPFLRRSNRWAGRLWFCFSLVFSCVGSLHRVRFQHVPAADAGSKLSTSFLVLSDRESARGERSPKLHNGKSIGFPEIVRCPICQVFLDGATRNDMTLGVGVQKHFFSLGVPSGKKSEGSA